MLRKSSLFTAALAAVLFCLGAGSAQAAPPVNDDFADSIQLTGQSGTISGTTAEATVEEGEPVHFSGSPDYSSVWYRWTAPANGAIRVDSCENPSPHGVALYRGNTVDSLTPVAVPNNCVLFVMVEAGVTYRLAIATPFSDAKGPFSFEFEVLDPPSNDAFADAEVLQGANDYVTGRTYGASRETGEPDHYSGGGNASVWYAWTAPMTGRASVDICDNNFDSVLAVYRGGSVNALTEVAADSCRVDFETVAGETYRIAVDGESGYEGEFGLGLLVGPVPANDDFADARELSGAPVTVTGTNHASSLEVDEPAHSSFGGRSVWYDWTPSTTGLAVVDVCDTRADLLPAVYTGDELSTLDYVQAGACRFVFEATAGESYKIAVFGETADDTGNFALTLRMVQRPANDDFADATAISGATVTRTGDSAGATTEPAYDGATGATVWFEWSPPADGTYTFDLCGSQFDTYLTLYRIDELGDPIQVTSNDDSEPDPSNPEAGDCGYRSAITRDVEAGETYALKVDGYSLKDFGPYQLRIYPGGFVPLKYSVEVEKAGNGQGDVLAENDNAVDVIDCGPTCEAQLNDDDGLYLEAVAAAGSEFAGWRINGEVDDRNCFGNRCILRMMRDTQITATFNSVDTGPGQKSLTVNKTGTGQGSVTSSPAGIDCGATCAAAFATGTTVTLNPAPAADATFTGWSGACSGTGPCVVTLGQDAAVTAEFSAKPSPAKFTLKTGRVKLNRKAGTATVPVTVSGAAKISLTGKGVKAQRANASGAKTVRLTVKATGKLKKQLKKKGRAAAKVKVTATPATGGAVTKKLNIKLKQSKKKKRKG